MRPADGAGSRSVSVLVPVLNEARHLEAAVQTMAAQEYRGEIEFLLIDGGSEDGTLELIERLAQDDSRIRLLRNPARRTPSALNIGLRSAQGEYVARMDAHTLYPSHYLERGVARLERGAADWVSGPQLSHGAGQWSSLVALALSRPLGVGAAAYRSNHDDEIEVDSGFTGVWRRDLLESFGGWDEEWAINQDGELAARIRDAGGRIVLLPEMAAEYVPRDSARALARQYRRYGKYRVKTSVRHPGSMRPSHLMPPALTILLLLGAAAPRPLRGVARMGAAAYGAVVLVESARAARTRRELALLPLVFLCMHLSWGLGFLSGCVRYGFPVRAITSALRRAAAVT